MKGLSKKELVELFEVGTGISIKEYVTNILGYKCCENWSREELIDEWGFSYCAYVNERMSGEGA